MFNEHCPLFILPHDLLHYNVCLGPLGIKKIERDFLNVISKNCATIIIKTSKVVVNKDLVWIVFSNKQCDDSQAVRG